MAYGNFVRRSATASSPDDQNFNHLVLDIAYFGLAMAATTRFLSVYAIRVGATTTDLGWISALPALILLISSSFGVWWSNRYKNPVHALYLPGLLMRLVFLLPAFAPFFPMHLQPLWLIIAVSIPAFPQGPAGVSFQVVMLNAIKPSRMTHLLSKRSLALNITVAIGALVFGVWLEHIPFPLNYQVMFVLAFICGLLSWRHCLAIKMEPVSSTQAMLQAEVLPVKPKFSPWKHQGFRKVATVAAVMHVTMFSIVSLTQLYLVENLGATEGFIALFAMVELAAGALASIFTRQIATRIGNLKMIAFGMIGTAIAALIFVVAQNMYVTLIGAAISGACWTAAASVGLFAYFVERIPSEEMASCSVAYNQIIGLALFIAPLIGSVLTAMNIPLVMIMFIGGALRFVAYPLIFPESMRFAKKPKISPEPVSISR